MSLIYVDAMMAWIFTCSDDDEYSYEHVWLNLICSVIYKVIETHRNINECNGFKLFN